MLPFNAFITIIFYSLLSLELSKKLTAELYSKKNRPAFLLALSNLPYLLEVSRLLLNL